MNRLATNAALRRFPIHPCCYGRPRCCLTESRTEARNRMGNKTSATRSYCSGHGHGMPGRPLLRSLIDGPLLVLCILPCGDDTEYPANFNRLV
jgi:hypothetical protein